MASGRSRLRVAVRTLLKTRQRTRRRTEQVEEEPGAERAIIIIGAVVAGLIALFIAFIIIRRVTRSESTAVPEPAISSRPVAVQLCKRGDFQVVVQFGCGRGLGPRLHSC